MPVGMYGKSYCTAPHGGDSVNKMLKFYLSFVCDGQGVVRSDFYMVLVLHS